MTSRGRTSINPQYDHGGFRAFVLWFDESTAGDSRDLTQVDTMYCPNIRNGYESSSVLSGIHGGVQSNSNIRRSSVSLELFAMKNARHMGSQSMTSLQGSYTAPTVIIRFPDR